MIAYLLSVKSFTAGFCQSFYFSSPQFLCERELAAHISFLKITLLTVMGFSVVMKSPVVHDILIIFLVVHFQAPQVFPEF